MRNDSSKPNLFLKALLTGFFFCSTVLSSVSLAADSDKNAPRLFVTKDGDRIVGTLLNPDQNPSKVYQIQTPDDKKVTIFAHELKNHRRASDAEVEYVKRRAAATDTVKAQWELAEWCRTKYFLSDRKKHLKRIIELEPDHKEARTSLGYRRFNDKWMTQEEIQKSRGYKRYKGKSLTEQQIKAAKKAEAREKEEKRWYVNIKRYVGWIGTSRSEQAMRAFAKIKDPAAVPALGRFLASDLSRDFKLLFIRILANIIAADPKKGATAQQPLALAAIEDPDEEVRLSCLDVLKKIKDPNVVDFFIGKLNVKMATRKYKGDANMMVNRAALALGQIGDTSVVGPLIKVLITAHKKKITSGNSGQTSATFSNRGGGLSMGSKTKIVTFHIQNQDVLDALRKLTGVSFNFDVDAWEAWHDHQTRQAVPNTRRGK